MNTLLIMVGKTDNKMYAEAIDDYAKRIGHYMPFRIAVIPDIKNRKSIGAEQQKLLEGTLIMKQITTSDTVVLLDEHGLQQSSVEFASWLQKVRMTARRLVFVIGGPYGFSDDMYKRADTKLSLSSMTFSHQMVRLIFAEQLYRACTIIKGEPYHHE